ncbi:hypothetical protein SDC9_164437 [bioreactor metagenome]|uniref:Cyclopropane-fatty-acyl-phospholipid synthase n=1 Tax=bioreactor metagenome TaxID=1076179 RepID=A0A645FRN0_9ZZZZ
MLRAYRLYLAGCAMGFERGWISLHQMLATRPDGDLQSGTLPGAQSVYPFTRDYMYAPRERARELASEAAAPTLTTIS